MFGRLPLIHRIGLAAAAVVVCAMLGLWAGASPEVPVVPPFGTLAGLVLGAVAAWLLVREEPSAARQHARRTTGHHGR